MRFDQKEPTIVVYMDDPESPSFVRAEENGNRSRSLGQADPTSADATETLLQACRTRLSALGGGEIHFGLGTYLHKTNWSAPANTIISGEGYGTILDCNSAATGIGPSVTLGNYCSLKNLKILGTTDRSISKGGVYASGHDISIDRVWINASWGLYVISNSHDIFVRNLYGYGCKGPAESPGFDFILIDGDTGPVYNVYIDGFYAEACDRLIEVQDGPCHHIYFSNGKGKSVGNSWFVTTKSMSLDVHQHTGKPVPYDVHFSNIELESCERGINVNCPGGVRPYDIFFDGIKIVSPDLTANSALAYIDGYKVHITNSVLEDCVVGAGNAQIYLETTAQDIELNNCDIIHASGSGSAAISSRAPRVNIVGCEFYPYNFGIYLKAEASDNTVERCHSTAASGTNQILLYGATRCNILNNVLGGATGGNIKLDSSASNNRIWGNRLTAGTAPLLTFGTLGAGNIIFGNSGYIARGEVRTHIGSIVTLTENAFNSIDNPFGQNVALLSLDIYVATGATATSPNIDCGIGSSATTDYTNLFDDLPGETIGLYNSKVATPGAQTQPILWHTGAGNRYLNMSIKDAAATGMVATYVATVMGV